MIDSVADRESAQAADLIGLMRDVYGHAMSEAEFDWFFDSNPLGVRIVSTASDEDRITGAAAMMLARALVGGRERRVAFVVHAVTHPNARGRGIFSRLELRNEERAADAGAAVALAFPNPMAGPVLVGKLGWRDLYRMRIWARPLRPLRALRRRSSGGLPHGRRGELERFTDAQERAWRAVQLRWGSCIVRDADYLNWRYVDAPRDYRAFTSEHGYAVVGHTVRKGVSAAYVCDLVGPPDEQRQLLRRCVEEARCGGADVAVAVPAPDQRAAHLSLGFIPMPLTMRVIGKPLSPGTEVGTDWHFSLGDTDFL